jgi:nicotinamide mononucleotide (NMN) deamidase PncC
LKRRKEAELLVRQDLPAQYVRGYVVYNERAKQRLIELGVAPEKIVAVPGYFF